mgnify:CR=1 FL=1
MVNSALDGRTPLLCGIRYRGAILSAVLFLAVGSDLNAAVSAKVPGRVDRDFLSRLLEMLKRFCSDENFGKE